ncbi:MAG: M1 family aminopeptidase [Elusimicrobiota bacterium]
MMTQQHICRKSIGSWDARFTLKGSSASYAPDRTFDTEHIKLAIEIDLNKEKLWGRCTTTLKAIVDGVSIMTFDAVHFEIERIFWNGKKVTYSYKDGKISVNALTPVKAGTIVTIDIDYSVTKPKMGLYFVKPNKFYPKNPTQAWTQGEDEYARYWFPCHDAPHERTTTEIVVTVPHGFTAVSNGKLIKKSQSKSKEVFHWRHDIPHATYLVTLTVGRFSELKDKWRHIPVTYYCEKGREADTQRAFGKTPKMLEFFSKKIGTAYPFAKYAQIAAADFIYGGMENTSATTQTDSALLDARVSLDYNSDELVAHELAHQWFGDYLTCKDWSHAWLNESFATYFDPLFKQYDKGDDEFYYHLRGNAEAYFQEDKEHYRRPISTKVFKRPTDLFDRHLYEKGSLVLHMLRGILGDDLFWKSIALYVRKNAGKTVETLDLINAIEEATGRNMRKFFDQWIFGAGHPELKIRSWWDSRNKEMVFRLTQTQAQTAEVGLFDLSAEFLFLINSKEKRVKAPISKKSHLFKFKCEKEPELILFDPDHIFLKKVDFSKSEKMWQLQLQCDKNILGRLDAAQTLGNIKSQNAFQILRQQLLEEPFWAVQAEIVRAISSFGTQGSSKVLLNSLDVIDHPKVRRAIYAALKNYKSYEVSDFVAKAYRKEASYFAEAEGLRTLGALRHPQSSQYLKEALEKNSWNDVIRQAALEGLAATKSIEWIPTFLAYSKLGHSHKLRMAAIRCLASYNTPEMGIQKRLCELTQDSFLLVQISAVRVLQQLGDERCIPALKELITGDRDGRLMRLAEEAIEKISKGFEGELGKVPNVSK